MLYKTTALSFSHFSFSKVSRTLVAGALPVMVVAATPAIAQAFSFSNLYVFGDSISDTGNAYRATGNQIPPSPPYANGRFSNGPIWVEYLAPQLGITSNPATNFAFGGATTGNTNVLFPGASLLGLPGLQQEVAAFTAVSPIADPNGLYVVFAGANDYLGGNQTNPAIPVQNLATAISTLAQAGARNFLVPNLPNLGSVPGTSSRPEAPALNALTAAHNQLLAQTLSLLDQQLEPSTQLILFDFNGLFSQAIANPAQFGFTNVTDACLSLSPLSLCSNPDTYLFWDQLHPTTAAHRQVANAAYSTVQAAIPEPPATLGLLAFGAFLGAASALKRKRSSLNLNVSRVAVKNDEKAG